MMRRYTELFAAPGTLAFSAAGFLARMPIAMRGLAVVILVQRQTGSYGIAGAVAGTYGVISSFTSPLVARLMDRHGQARLLRPAALLEAGAFAVLVACALTGAPLWTLFVAAGVAALPQVPVGSLVRARWSHALSGSPMLPTAYALESVLDELIFVFGPLVVTVVATTFPPATGVTLAVGLLLSGSFLLARQRSTEPPLRRTTVRTPMHRRGRVGILVIALVLGGSGAVFGGAEVTTVAFTDALGQPKMAGVLLGIWALSSMGAGLAYGAKTFAQPLDRQFLLVVAAFALTSPLLLLPSTIWQLAAVMAVAGLTISPLLITGFGLVARLVPPDRLTEGLTWATAGLSLSFAVSTAAAGRLIDAYGPRAGFWVSLVGGVTAAVLAWGGSRWLHPGATPAQS